MYFLSSSKTMFAKADSLYIDQINRQPNGDKFAIMAVSSGNKYLMETFRSECDAKDKLYKAFIACFINNVNNFKF